jgi:hypothetical protein
MGTRQFSTLATPATPATPGSEEIKKGVSFFNSIGHALIQIAVTSRKLGV